MTDQACRNCNFVQGRINTYAEFDELRCRRYPPQFSGGKWDDTFSQPKVNRDGWCGEWAKDKTGTLTYHDIARGDS